MPSVTIHAPAKINLRLKVCGKREDGYHFLSMLNERLTFGDTIGIETLSPPERYKGDFSVSVQCDAGSELCTESNLIVKAARKLAERYEVSTPLHMRLVKRIPVGAGLGGGSSDAAACIMALNKLWGLYRPNDELEVLGSTIGADVPFFFCNGPAHVTGIGERVDPNVVLPKLWVLLVNPGFEISTKEVYGSLDFGLTEIYEDASFRPLFNDLDDLKPFIENDLEKVVSQKHGEINVIKDYLIEKGAAAAFMSGSGSTVVGLFRCRKDRDLALLGAGTTGWSFFPTENIGRRR